MSVADGIVLGIVALWMIASCVWIRRQKKRGGGCHGSCEGCSHACNRQQK